RSHPLNDNVTLSEAIQNERQLLKDVKRVSSYIIDTTNLSKKKLKENISNYLNYDRNEGFTVNVLSFGFKHEIQKDADIMFDVRFVTHPSSGVAIRPIAVLDEDVYDYIKHFEDSEMFDNKVGELLNLSLPRYVKEGRSQLSAAIVCTGGQHRSVAL